MTQTIWKETLQANTDQIINIPEGSTILSCGVQGEDIVVWYLVRDQNAMIVPVRVRVIPTGMESIGIIPEKFLGTVQFPGEFVFHVFVEYTTGFADRA